MRLRRIVAASIIPAMNLRNASYARRIVVPVLAAIITALSLAPIALATSMFGRLRISANSLQTQIDARVTTLGEPATKVEKTELKNLRKASLLLVKVDPDLLELDEPEGLFNLRSLKSLSKVGGLVEKSGTADGPVLLAFQQMFESIGDWGDALDDIYDASMPSLSEKEGAKVEAMAQKARDTEDVAQQHFADGELGKASQVGLKALTLFAKATALARKYASD